jgi:hypothetical protein
MMLRKAGAHGWQWELMRREATGDATRCDAMMVMNRSGIRSERTLFGVLSALPSWQGSTFLVCLFACVLV